MEWMGERLATLLPPMAVLILIGAVAGVIVWFKIKSMAEKIRGIEEEIKNMKEAIDKNAGSFCKEHGLISYKIDQVMTNLEVFRKEFNNRSSELADLIINGKISKINKTV